MNLLGFRHGHEHSKQPREHALLARIARLDADPGRQEAVALGLVDAILVGDSETLERALHALRNARALAGDTDRELIGWLDAAIAFAHWGLERAPSKPPWPRERRLTTS